MSAVTAVTVGLGMWTCDLFFMFLNISRVSLEVECVVIDVAGKIKALLNDNIWLSVTEVMRKCKS